MSTPPEHEHPGHGAAHHDVVRSEEDRISTGAIVFVGVASLVVFFVASWVATGFLRDKQRERGPVAVPAEIGDSKIGVVEQQLFESGPLRGTRDRARRLERLGSYGWVDRSQGVVHLPIGEAMNLVAQGVRPAGAPAQGEQKAAPGGQP